MHQLKSIQALRALAAIAVMFAHLYGVEAGQSGGPSILPPVIVAGISGVDLFFVISGFIMVWVAGDWAPGPRSCLKFLFARVTRIYPVWWLFLGALAAYFYLTLGVPWEPAAIAGFRIEGPEHVLKSFLLIPHEVLPTLTLGWTLMHEMYFYVVFSLLLFLPVKWRGLAMVLWGLVIVAAMLTGQTRFYAQTLLSLALFPMTLEFLFGAAIGWMIKAGITRWAGPALMLGIGLFIYAIWHVDLTIVEASQPVQRTLYFGSAATLIVYGLVALEVRSQRASWAHPVLVHIGDWSYSLYLGHLLVLSAIGRVFFDLFGQDGVLDNIAYLVIASLSALAFAGLTYHLFERPLLSQARRVRKAWFDPPMHNSDALEKAAKSVKD